MPTNLDSENTDTASVAAALHRWATAFNQGDTKVIVSLYETNATLWGSYSTALICSHEDIRSYFDAAFALRPRLEVRIGEYRAAIYGQTAVASGEYTFTQGEDVMSARFSLTFVKLGDFWRVVQHHSSALPISE